MREFWMLKGQCLHAIHHYICRMYRLLISALAALLFTACQDSSQQSNPEVESPQSNSIPFAITELSDEQYPDNPDIGFRAADYDSDYFTDGELVLDSLGQVAFVFRAEQGDSIWFAPMDLAEFIPTAPEHIQADPYLTRISIINQEWNRNQVRFAQGEFESNNTRFVRADVARNCLNACLWEVAVYVEEDGKTTPYAHGWFDFPLDLYSELFESCNHLDYEAYAEPLEHWVDPISEKVDLSLLAINRSPVPVAFADLSDAMYPVAGARKKKFKEIITPVSFETMRDLQSDSTTFATFTPPGFYNRADPRTTELGRFKELIGCEVAETSHPGGASCTEITFTFTDGTRTTQAVFGGLNLQSVGSAPVAEANGAWRTSMGIGNHPFYETQAEHMQLHASGNPYYGLLLDADGKWLDSHTVGIDGPILHWDEHNPELLHVWLLSFERHALIGHYTISFDLSIS